MKHRKIFTIISAITFLTIILFIPCQVLNAQPNSDKAGTKVFRAGAATSNITPFLGGGVKDRVKKKFIE